MSHWTKTGSFRSFPAQGFFDKAYCYSHYAQEEAKWKIQTDLPLLMIQPVPCVHGLCMKDVDKDCNLPNSHRLFAVVLTGLDGQVKERWPHWVQADAHAQTGAE